jgi:hypothetical protein
MYYTPLQLFLVTDDEFNSWCYQRILFPSCLQHTISHAHYLFLVLQSIMEEEKKENSQVVSQETTIDPLNPCGVCNSTVFNVDGTCGKCHKAALLAILHAQIQALQESIDAEETSSPRPPVTFVDTKPFSTFGISHDTTSSIDASTNRFSRSSGHPPPTFASVVSNPTSLPPGIISCSNNLVSSNSPSFVHAIINGKRPLLGTGSESRNHGIQLVAIWGLADNDVPLPISALTAQQLHRIPALVSRAFFEGDKRVMLEEQSLVRHTFNSSTMPLQMPRFIVAVKQVKAFYRGLVRQNMRQAMLETARLSLPSTGYIPFTQLRSSDDLVLELSRDLLCSGMYSKWTVWWSQIKSSHICDWAPVSSKNNLDILSSLAMAAMGITYRHSDRLCKGCFRRTATKVFHDQVSWLQVFKTAMLVSSPSTSILMGLITSSRLTLFFFFKTI